MEENVGRVVALCARVESRKDVGAGLLRIEGGIDFSLFSLKRKGGEVVTGKWC